MIAIRTSHDGLAMTFEDASVVGLAGPRRGDPASMAFVFVQGYQPIGTTDDVPSLLARLAVTPQTFAKLTRPNNTPIWIRGHAIEGIRPNINPDTPLDEGNMTRAVVEFGALHQEIREDVATAIPIMRAAGASPRAVGDESAIT